MKMMGIRVTPAAEVEGVVVNVSESSLAGMREQIGCRVVDVVRLDHGIDGWIDDEGIYTQQVNMLATVLATTLGRGTRSAPLYGPILFLTHDEDGTTRSLSPEQYQRIVRLGAMSKAALTRAEALTVALAQ